MAGSALDAHRLSRLNAHPIVPAEIDFDAGGSPAAPAFDDIYHPAAEPGAQARHVFLRSNGLPQRWQGRHRFVIVETGFGLGHNFLATLDAWRSDPQRCRRLHYLAVDLHPPRKPDLERALACWPTRDAAAALVSAWPPLTCNLHRLAFERGAVELLLAFGDATTWLRQVEAEADAFYLDGFAPDRNPAMWSEMLFRALPRIAARGATAATWSAARAVRDGLAAAGFRVEAAPGFGAKRDMTVARFEPIHEAHQAARRRAALPGARSATVIGAGIAGALVAEQLAAEGLEVTVLEAAGAAAAGASGNPGGLFRGIVQRQEGPHARLHRTAALAALQHYGPLVQTQQISGQADGVLHLIDDAAVAEARQLISRQGLPPAYAELLDGDDAAELAGMAVGPAWYFRAGGWIDPGRLVAHALSTPGIRLINNARVATFRSAGAAWICVDEAGRPLARSDLLVLANAADAGRLAPWARWRLSSSRGQVSWLDAQLAGLALPRLPLARTGYAFSIGAGQLLCGATGTIDDFDPALREADHRHNLATLARLSRQPINSACLDALSGRVAWRCLTPDRLPVVGPVPAPNHEVVGTQRPPRQIERQAGLFVCTALGARGLTLAPLLARSLAAQMLGAPVPLDAGLIDAIDPARFVAREPGVIA